MRVHPKPRHAQWAPGYYKWGLHLDGDDAVIFLDQGGSVASGVDVNVAITPPCKLCILRSRELLVKYTGRRDNSFNVYAEVASWTSST